MDVGIDTRPTGDMKPWSWEEIDERLIKLGDSWFSPKAI